MKRGRKSKFCDNDTLQNKWNVALYIRLSVQDGDKAESNSVANQRELLDMFIKKDKELNFYNYYIDDGFSGTNFERPSFKKMIKDIDADLVNAVVVKDLSRLGRNYIEVGNYIEKVFPLFSIRFIAINDQIDSIKNPESVNSVIVPFKNLINDEYCRDISNKIKAVLNVKMKKGEYVGAYAPYGYIKDPEDIHHLIIDEDAAKVVKMIFEMTLNGYGRTAIAKKLNELGILNPTGHRAEELKMRIPVAEEKKNIKYSWCSTTVRQILKNEMYCGDTIQHKGKLISYKIHKRVLLPEEEWVVVKDTHEAIIDRELFDKVQKAILSRDTKMNRDGKISIFAGHIKCGDCERAMSKKISGSYNGKKREKYHYMCSAYMRSGGTRCSKHSIRNDELENAVLETIKIQIGLISDIDRIKKEIDDGGFLEKRKHFLEENINKCEEFANIRRKLRKEAYEDWKLGNITEKEYNDYTKEYGEQIRQSEDTIDKYYEELKEFDQASRESNWIEYFTKYKNVNSLSRELIDSLVDNIYIYEDKKIKIKFKYEDEYNYLMDFIKRRKNFMS